MSRKSKLESPKQISHDSRRQQPSVSRSDTRPTLRIVPPGELPNKRQKIVGADQKDKASIEKLLLSADTVQEKKKTASITNFPLQPLFSKEWIASKLGSPSQSAIPASSPLFVPEHQFKSSDIAEKGSQPHLKQKAISPLLIRIDRSSLLKKRTGHSSENSSSSPSFPTSRNEKLAEEVTGGRVSSSSSSSSATKASAGQLKKEATEAPPHNGKTTQSNGKLMKRGGQSHSNPQAIGEWKSDSKSLVEIEQNNRSSSKSSSNGRFATGHEVHQRLSSPPPFDDQYTGLENGTDSRHSKELEKEGRVQIGKQKDNKSLVNGKDSTRLSNSSGNSLFASAVTSNNLQAPSQISLSHKHVAKPPLSNFKSSLSPLSLETQRRLVQPQTSPQSHDIPSLRVTKRGNASSPNRNSPSLSFPVGLPINLSSSAISALSSPLDESPLPPISTSLAYAAAASPSQRRPKVAADKKLSSSSSISSPSFPASSNKQTENEYIANSKADFSDIKSPLSYASAASPLTPSSSQDAAAIRQQRKEKIIRSLNPEQKLLLQAIYRVFTNRRNFHRRHFDDCREKFLQKELKRIQSIIKQRKPLLFSTANLSSPSTQSKWQQQQQSSLTTPSKVCEIPMVAHQRCFTTWTPVMANVCSKEDPTLRFCPYFDDSLSETSNWYSEYRELFEESLWNLPVEKPYVIAALYDATIFLLQVLKENRHLAEMTNEILHSTQEEPLATDAVSENTNQPKKTPPSKTRDIQSSSPECNDSDRDSEEDDRMDELQALDSHENGLLRDKQRNRRVGGGRKSHQRCQESSVSQGNGGTHESNSAAAFFHSISHIQHKRLTEPLKLTPSCLVFLEALSQSIRDLNQLDGEGLSNLFASLTFEFQRLCWTLQGMDSSQSSGSVTDREDYLYHQWSNNVNSGCVPFPGVRLPIQIPLTESSLEESQETYSTLFCKRCMVFECPLHGIETLSFDSSRRKLAEASASRNKQKVAIKSTVSSSGVMSSPIRQSNSSTRSTLIAAAAAAAATVTSASAIAIPTIELSAAAVKASSRSRPVDVAVESYHRQTAICSLDCFRSTSSKSSALKTQSLWTTEELELLMFARRIFNPLTLHFEELEEKTICNIALLVPSKSCEQVFQRLQFSHEDSSRSYSSSVFVSPQLTSPSRPSSLSAPFESSNLSSAVAVAVAAGSSSSSFSSSLPSTLQRNSNRARKPCKKSVVCPILNGDLQSTIVLPTLEILDEKTGTGSDDFNDRRIEMGKDEDESGRNGGDGDNSETEDDDYDGNGDDDDDEEEEEEEDDDDDDDDDDENHDGDGEEEAEYFVFAGLEEDSETPTGENGIDKRVTSRPLNPKGRGRRRRKRTSGSFANGHQRQRQHKKVDKAIRIRQALANLRHLYNLEFEAETQGEHWHFPCNHEGRCDSSCSCRVNFNVCEPLCNCSPECSNRWVGCQCSGGCKTNSCPCFAASRECDPVLCRRCGASVLPSDPHTDLRGCQNVNLLYHIRRRLLVGPSTVAGLGAFAGENINKGQFITEYTGEIILQEDADRRGTVYDARKHSYLFNLSRSYAIDATRAGNKSRFINHSANPNCYPKLLKVRGDLRIGMFALRAIRAGEELFFDYNYPPEIQQQLGLKTAKKESPGSHQRSSVKPSMKNAPS